MTSVLCALCHVDNHILYTLGSSTFAKEPICELVYTRGSLSPSDWGRRGGGGGLSDGMKKYK